MMTEMPRYITVSEAAQTMGLDESTVYKMCRNKQLPSVRIGPKSVRIPRLAFERHLAHIEGEWSPDPDTAPEDEPTLEPLLAAFELSTGRTPEQWADAWRAGEIKDTQENARIAISALALRDARQVSEHDEGAGTHESVLALAALTSGYLRR